MTQPQQHCDHECVCPDYKASHSENGEDECYGDPDPCSLSCYHRSHPYQSERDTVWVVAESRFEWYEIRYICSSKEVALQRWVELRDELINGFQEMVEYCIKEDYHDADDWRKRIDTLKNLKPGESCDCDYPDLKEWGVELRQKVGD